MKLLVVCQHYWPEQYRLTDICEALVQRGHQVDVVTGLPNYPMGYIFPEYQNRKRRKECHNGVNIYRTFTIGRRNNIIFRFLNYFSFALSSCCFIKKLDKDYDAVLSYQTSPVTMSLAALKYKKRTGKNVLLYCLDLWPAVLSVIGMKPENIIYKALKAISKKVYSSATSIAVGSPGFEDYLKNEFGIPSEKIHYLPQHAEEIYIESQKIKNGREKYNFVFAGNIGIAQSMPTIIKAAQYLKDDNVVIHIIGDGSELENCKKAARELKADNIRFYGRITAEEILKYYAMADAMIVSLIDDENVSLTLPAKVQSYMAAGKPLIVSANGATSDVVKKAQCGFCAPAQNAEALADVIRDFISYNEKDKLGQNSYSYYKQNFDKELFMNNLENMFQDLISGCDAV